MGGSGYEPPCGTAPRGASAEDRQAGISHYCLHAPTWLRGSLLADQRQTPDSEQSLGLDPMPPYWGISGLVPPKCQGTEVITSAPAPQLLIQCHQAPMPPSSQKPSTHLAASFKHFNTLFLQGTLGQGTPCLSVKSLLEGLLSLCCHPHCSSKLKTDRTNTENMLQQPPVWEGRQWGRGRQPGCPITSVGYGCEMKQVHFPPGYHLPQCNLR